MWKIDKSYKTIIPVQRDWISPKDDTFCLIGMTDYVQVNCTKTFYINVVLFLSDRFSSGFHTKTKEILQKGVLFNNVLSVFDLYLFCKLKTMFQITITHCAIFSYRQGGLQTKPHSYSYLQISNIDTFQRHLQMMYQTKIGLI